MALSVPFLLSCFLNKTSVLLQIFIAELTLKSSKSTPFSTAFLTCILLEAVLRYLWIRASWAKRILLKSYHCTADRLCQLSNSHLWISIHTRKQFNFLASISIFAQWFGLQSHQKTTLHYVP